MKAVSITACMVAFLALAGVCSPSAVLAADAASLVADVAMTADGRLVGQVVDAQGAPLAETLVFVRSQDRELVRVATDQNGLFAVKGLPAGIYQFVAAEGLGSYRVWTSEMAPPGAGQGALIVAGQDLVRGNLLPGGLGCNGMGCIQGLLCNPWFMAATVAASVAVPVAIHNGERDDIDIPTSP
jgi:hypothetical protein